MIEKDIVIIGGGLTGCILLLALQQSGLNVLLVEQKTFTNTLDADFDARSLALAPASVNILKSLKVWDSIKQFATPIETIHISQLGSFGSAKLYAKPDNPLGYVIEIKYLQSYLYKMLNKKNIIAPATVIDFNCKHSVVKVDASSRQSTFKAKLVVAADGVNSQIRKFSAVKSIEKIYQHVAIVANIGLKRSHGNFAYERFTKDGPIALLPLTDQRASLVWSLPKEKALNLQQLNNENFLNNLQKTFGYRLGRFTKVGRRDIFPLSQVIIQKQNFSSLIFVGNAAHTLHPVAGQGFNLGVRDVALLAECILKHGLNKQMLDDYKLARTHDQKIISKFTDGIVNLFSNNLPLITLARNIGLTTFDNLSVLKKIVTHYAQGFAGVVPDLACGIPLKVVDFDD